MSLLLLSLLVIALLTAGYLLYGSFIARQYNLDDANATPATVKNDGVDFVPTRPFYLMGQHFSAIAAAGPIVGPVLACLAFGWLPCILWIVLGVVLIGAVHDFSALVASVRHGAHSIAEVARQHLGRRAYLSLVGFIWLALLYVIVAFTEVTAETFIGVSEEIAGIGDKPGWTFNGGGAVAAGATAGVPLLILLASERGSYKLFWTLFGTSNQLLAALTLLRVTVWLYRSGKRFWYTAIPAAFVMIATLTALALQIFQAVRAAAAGQTWTDNGMSPVVMNGVVGAALLIFAVVFIAEAVRSVRSFHRERPAALPA